MSGDKGVFIRARYMSRIKFDIIICLFNVDVKRCPLFKAFLIRGVVGDRTDLMLIPALLDVLVADPDPRLNEYLHQVWSLYTQQMSDLLCLCEGICVTCEHVMGRYIALLLRTCAHQCVDVCHMCH